MAVALFSILTGTTDGATDGDPRTRMQTHSEYPSFTSERKNNFFDRMQVRIFSVLVNKYLTRSSYSRKVGPQQFPLRMWGRASARRAQRMSQRNPRDRPERHRTLGKRLGQVSRLLVERSGRDGEEHHREDHRGEVICRWPARSLLFLFTGFRGSEEPSDDIPNTGRPTRSQVH